MILLVLVVAVLAGAGLLSLGLVGGRGDGAQGGRPWGWLGVTLLAGLAGLVLFGLFVFALRGGAGPDDAVGTPTVTTVAAPERALPPGTSRVEAGAPRLPVLALDAARADRAAGRRVVAGLAPDGVVRVLVGGFHWYERGTVAQCVAEPERVAACTESFPVQFDEDGRADIQYLLRASFAPGRCRVGEPTCTVRVTGSSGRTATIQTVLVDDVAPGRIRVEPATGLVDGQRVSVAVSALPPSMPAVVRFCGPGGTDARRCGPPVAGFTVDAGGAGATRLTVRTGTVGAEEVQCGPRHGCTLLVTTGRGFVAAQPVPVHWSLGPGAGYDPRRLAIGLLVALALAATAVALIARTDWSAPTEAAAPEMDAADLETGRTLDELFGTDAELEAASGPGPS